MSILREATQVAITGGTQIAVGAGSTINVSNASQARSVSKAFRDLSDAAAHTALYDSATRYDAPRCHRNTRTSYLDRLEQWMLGHGEHFEGKHLIWLQGGAGAGKSAIMQSVVERCARYTVILGTFFFSRSDSSRNNAEVLIPTLAYQLAHRFPASMAILEPVIDHNPLISKASLDTQAYHLLVRPIIHLLESGIIDNSTSYRRVFVIDGLDECEHPEKQALLINVIATILCQHHLPIHFLVASRPELAISNAFQKENRLHEMFATISLDDSDDACADIRQFIEDSFRDIVDTHPMRTYITLPWPQAGSVHDLVRKSSGHFIYAATAMKFIASSDEHPARALQVIEGLEPSRTRSPFAELDALYLHIITSAKYSKQVLAILRQCFLIQLDRMSEYSASIVSVVQGISLADVDLFLSDVRAIVSVCLDAQSTFLAVRPKHLSLYDFIRDESRSQMLYIPPEHYYASMLPRFFHLLATNATGLSYSRLAYWNRLHKEIPTDGGNLFILAICESIRCCKDSELLTPLVHRHSPRDIWFFHQDASVAIGPPFFDNWAPIVRSLSVARYMTAIRDSISNKGYLQQFSMYMRLLLDLLSADIGDATESPQDAIIIGVSPGTRKFTNVSINTNRLVPALIFSASPSILRSTHHFIFRFHSELGINQHYACYLVHLVDSAHSSRIHERTAEALRQLPQRKLLWGSDLAVVMKIVFRVLLCQSWRPPFYFTNQHERWLKHSKPFKYISIGSPRLSSRFYDSGRRRDWSKLTTKYDYGLPYHRKFSPARGPFPPRLCDRRTRIMCDEGYDCILLLKAVIFFLCKADYTSEVAQLARKSLPRVTLWFPGLMKRARREMDGYVRQWEASVEGVLEKAQSFSINSLD